jgi:hypothetical protein
VSRTMILAGMLVVVLPVAATTVQAQRVDGARALLAQVSPRFPSVASQVNGEPIDGQRALLGRTVARRVDVPSRDRESAPIDGASALLGRRR